jgi:hypothetical protein
LPGKGGGRRRKATAFYEGEEYSLPDAAREELTFLGRGNFGFLNHLRRMSIRPMI